MLWAASEGMTPSEIECKMIHDRLNGRVIMCVLRLLILLLSSKNELQNE